RPQRKLWAGNTAGKVASPRSSLEGHLGPGGEPRYVPPQHGWPTGRNGSRVQEAVNSGRKTSCPASRCCPLEQGQEPHSLCPAESARVYPPCNLGTGRSRTEEAGGNLQEPHRAAELASRSG